MPALSPIVSEFPSTEDAAAYEIWFRAKVQEALRDAGPDADHEAVMAEMRALVGIDGGSDA